MRKDLEHYLVSVPEEMLGTINAEIHSRGGFILSMENMDSHFEVRAGMPKGSMNDFSAWLITITHNRASFVPVNSK
jgi:translation elongation factor EF-G